MLGFVGNVEAFVREEAVQAGDRERERKITEAGEGVCNGTDMAMTRKREDNLRGEGKASKSRP